MLGLDELHEEIEKIYRYWHEIAPGVTPREHGKLGQYWRAVDAMENAR